MSLTAASLQQHDERTGSSNVILFGVSSGSARATCAPSRRSLASGAPRPNDQLGCILGFGAVAAQAAEKGAAADSERASSHAVAVGHGSVRPVRSQRSRQSNAGSDVDDVILESLEAQLEEERAGRRSLEEKVENIARMIERLNNVTQTASENSALHERATNAGRSSAVMHAGVKHGTAGKPPLPTGDKKRAAATHRR